MAKNYNNTLKYLYSQLPMYQRVGESAFKKNLDNIEALCEAMGNPQSKLKCIHVAGTNGKGTTSHIIAGILMANAYKVGIYTSPHYTDFRERIKIGNTLMSQKYVVDFVEKNSHILEKIKPSFFEITVAMAFDYFVSNQVDYAVIEVGLGGRLDSTNIITPLLSVITNIGYDHMNMLGNSLDEIAYEKAGIIKDHVPVLIGEYQKEINWVFELKAQQRQAPIYYAQQLVSIEYKSRDFFTECRYKKENISFDIDISGEFQQRNITTAMAAAQLLTDNDIIPNLSLEKFAEISPNFRETLAYKGRWQLLSRNPDVIVDSAHNIDGITQIINMLDALPYTKVHFVMGMVNDKDSSKILSVLPKNNKYYFAKANIPRGLDAQELKSRADKHGLKGKAYSSVRKALAAAKISAKENELIFVGGSIFVVAEVI
ncbi:MAG TPA: folylpolyglutamate synthase/dihydrofolate synthase family protein [Saprospiraceae bacterium]|nr:folylpolyglutamate synthase/dihydrofolate synthase family protein [Saprospiraceae bacterium]